MKGKHYKKLFLLDSDISGTKLYYISKRHEFKSIILFHFYMNNTHVIFTLVA